VHEEHFSFVYSGGVESAGLFVGVPFVLHQPAVVFGVDDCDFAAGQGNESDIGVGRLGDSGSVWKAWFFVVAAGGGGIGESESAGPVVFIRADENLSAGAGKQYAVDTGFADRCFHPPRRYFVTRGGRVKKRGPTIGRTCAFG